MALIAFGALHYAQVPSLLSHYSWIDRGEGSLSSVFLVALLLFALPVYGMVWVVSVLVTACGRRISGGCSKLVLMGLLVLATLLGPSFLPFFPRSLSWRFFF